MEREFSLKELYDVTIKTTQQLKVGDYIFEEGETIVAFDKINLANFNEVRKVTTANGGFGNAPHVWWETVRDVQLTFTQGVFNKEQLSILTNAKLTRASNEPIFIPEREMIGLDLDNIATTKYDAYSPIFVYDKNDSHKVDWIRGTTNNKLIVTEPRSNMVIVDYWRQYQNKYQSLVIGQQLSNNAIFSLVGKTRVKEDQSGIVRSALICIPQLKLMSDLSMSLGAEAKPVIGSFYGLACPTGEKGNKMVMDIVFLEDDVDADI